MKDTPRITAIRKQWLLNSFAAGKKIRFSNGKLETYAASPPKGNLEEIIAAVREAMQPKIGEMVPGQGIYLGTWDPRDKQGNSLGKIFNVYAAPQDLTNAAGRKETFKYDGALSRIAALKNWHGHDGTSYDTDKELYKALKDGSYKGGWIIPPGELLHGKDLYGKKSQIDNLYDHKDKGALKNSFTATISTGYTYPEWYWSSTQPHNDPSAMQSVNFTNGTQSRFFRDILQLNCRPVRLVAAK